MEKDQRRVAFLKTLLAAAWADGELSAREIKTLAEYMRRLQITSDEYEELRPFMEQRVSLGDARSILEAQLQAFATPEERGTLLAAVEDLLVVDDHLNPAAGKFLKELRELFSHVPTAPLFVSRLRALWSVPPEKRGQARAHAHHGPRHHSHALVDQFFRQRLLEYLRNQMALARARAGQTPDQPITDHDLYRVAIWAGLLAKVAQADKNLADTEEDQLLELLRQGGGKDLPEPDLRVIVKAYVDDGLSQIDLPILVREFTQIASPDEGLRLLESLFLVAAADGQLRQSELTVIQEIASAAGFPEALVQQAFERCRGRMKSGWN